jgi:hypothetical protein
LAAAAVLVLAAAASLANLEVRRDADGWVVRTGWGRAAPGGAGTVQDRAAATAAAGALAPAMTATAAPPSANPSAPLDDAPWRAELAALRRELLAARSPQADPLSRGPVTAVSTRLGDEELLRRVQQLIDDSEVRQQRNLALRMTEVSRDFAIQRQADLVQIQQGFGRLEGRTEAEAARSRELMNYLVRVSQQQPPR